MFFLVTGLESYLYCISTERTENILLLRLAKMNRSVLVVLCLVTLSNIQLGESQCDGEV